MHIPHEVYYHVLALHLLSELSKHLYFCCRTQQQQQMIPKPTATSVSSLCWWSTSHFDCQCELFFTPSNLLFPCQLKNKVSQTSSINLTPKKIKITQAQTADLQQQAEGHRFESMVECKSPEIFLVSGHWKFFPASKRFFKIFYKDMENTFPKNVHKH